MVDQWWQFNDPDDANCALVARDQDGDGQPGPSSTGAGPAATRRIMAARRRKQQRVAATGSRSGRDGCAAVLPPLPVLARAVA